LKRKWLIISFDARIRYHYILKNIGEQHCLSILDVGAGPGYLAEELRRRNLKVVVSDINFYQMKKIKSSLKIDALVLDAAHLCFRDKAFDIVISSDVYEHLDQHQRVQFLKEILRVAKRKVIFTISQVHKDNPQNVGIKILKILTQDILSVDWWLEYNAKPFPHLQEIKRSLNDLPYQIKPYQGILSLFLLGIFIKLKLPHIFKLILNYFSYLILLAIDLPPFYSFLFTIDLIRKNFR